MQVYNVLPQITVPTVYILHMHNCTAQICTHCFYYYYYYYYYYYHHRFFHYLMLPYKIALFCIYLLYTSIFTFYMFCRQRQQLISHVS